MDGGAYWWSLRIVEEKRIREEDGKYYWEYVELEVAGKHLGKDVKQANGQMAGEHPGEMLAADTHLRFAYAAGW